MGLSRPTVSTKRIRRLSGSLAPTLAYCGLWLAALTIIGVASPCAPAVAQGEENVGQVSQSLVNGEVVSDAYREEFGLVTVAGRCSGALLRNTWVLTAAHCIDRPDSASPGTFITSTPASVNIQAGWGTNQSIQATRIVSFRPLDVAVVQVGSPFSVRGSTTGFSQQVCCGDPYPEWDHFPVEIVGRGINVFASGIGPTATPSQIDGQFRYGRAQITRLDTDLYWYASTDAGKIAGGDSGGPSFKLLRTGRAITGVHSLCRLKCVDGKACGTWRGPGSAPATYSPWDWVSGTFECADAPVEPVWRRIADLIRTTPPAPPPPTQFIGTFERNSESPRPIWFYAMKSSGDIAWYAKDSGDARWDGGEVVKSGLARGSRLVAAGRNAFYSVDPSGEVSWMRHETYLTGGHDWKGPVGIGGGWEKYRVLFGAGGGVVYGIDDAGTLYWMKNNAYRNMEPGAPYSWEGPIAVGSGWQVFSHAFSMGNGIIYGVRPDGEVFWYRHEGFMNGEARWGRTFNVASGWQGFSRLVAAGDGVVLAIRDDGTMYQYRHLDYGTGRSNDSAGTAGPAKGPESLSDQMNRRAIESPGSAVPAPLPSFGKVRGHATPSSRVGDPNASGAALGQPHWGGPERLGSGWNWVDSIAAILPEQVDAPH